MDLPEQVRGFDPELPIERGFTPPASWYVAPEFDTLERRAVFRRTWQFVCRTEQVAEPGSFVAGRSFGLSWVVVRGTDGTLRALANTCRHKATEVCTGAGSVDHFTCPYHGWTYHLDGSLRTAPRVAGIQGLDRGEMALPALQVETFGPLVFINADPDAAPLGLSELGEMLDASGWQDLRWHSRRTYEFDCNWKVFADNYLDGGYHIAHMHPSLAEQLDLDSYRTRIFDRFSVQTCRPAAGVDRIEGGAIYAWLYPNLMLNRYGPCLDSNLVVPITASRCRVFFDFWFAADTDPDWIAESLEQSDVTQQEDMWVSELAQTGMASGTWPRGRYAPGIEIGVHHFHRLLASDLRKMAE